MSSAAPKLKHPYDAEEGAAYGAVRAQVEVGRVDLYLILSPPRTLSTILGKTLAQKSDIGLWFNEPTSKFGRGENRVKESYKSILEGIEEARPLQDGVKRLLLSIITSSVGPELEARRLFDLA